MKMSEVIAFSSFSQDDPLAYLCERKYIIKKGGKLVIPSKYILIYNGSILDGHEDYSKSRKNPIIKILMSLKEQNEERFFILLDYTSVLFFGMLNSQLINNASCETHFEYIRSGGMFPGTDTPFGGYLLRFFDIRLEELAKITNEELDELKELIDNEDEEISESANSSFGALSLFLDLFRIAWLGDSSYNIEMRSILTSFLKLASNTDYEHEPNGVLEKYARIFEVLIPLYMTLGEFFEVNNIDKFIGMCDIFYTNDKTLYMADAVLLNLSNKVLKKNNTFTKDFVDSVNERFKETVVETEEQIPEGNFLNVLKFMPGFRFFTCIESLENLRFENFHFPTILCVLAESISNDFDTVVTSTQCRTDCGYIITHNNKKMISNHSCKHVTYSSSIISKGLDSKETPLCFYSQESEEIFGILTIGVEYEYSEDSKFNNGVIYTFSTPKLTFGYKRSNKGVICKIEKNSKQLQQHEFNDSASRNAFDIYLGYILETENFSNFFKGANINHVEDSQHLEDPADTEMFDLKEDPRFLNPFNLQTDRSQSLTDTTETPKKRQESKKLADRNDLLPGTLNEVEYNPKSPLLNNSNKNSSHLKLSEE